MPPSPGKQPIRKLDNTGNNRSTCTNRRPPKTAAVLVTSCKDDFTYADVLKKARENISLKELKIVSIKVR